MILKPFKIVPEIRWEFISFLLFTFFLGQAALILPLLELFNGSRINGLSDMIETGSLYITLIPLLGSSVYSLSYYAFINKVKNEQENYKKYRLAIFSISIFVLVISTYLYSRVNDVEITSKVMWMQIIVYVIGWYFILVGYLSGFFHLQAETFQDFEDKSIKRLKEEALKQNRDSRGVNYGN